MGVYSFYAKFLRALGPAVVARRMPPGVNEGIIVDLNGLLHRIAQEVYQYGSYDGPPRPGKVTKTALKKEYLEALSNTLEDIFKSVSVRQYIIICVDGIAPDAKIAQQRSRRYKAARENGSGRKPLADFNSAAISPGTTFMADVHKFMTKFIDALANQKRPAAAAVPVIVYDPHTSHGEGEHKAFAHLRAVADNGAVVAGAGNHLIYGMDADLSLLAMLSPFARQTFLVRESFTDTVSIRGLQQAIAGEMNRPGLTSLGVVEDFITMTFLVGNDFLPRNPAMEGLKWSALFAAYRDAGVRIAPFPGNEDGLKAFFKALASYEPGLLSDKAAEERARPDSVVVPSSALTNFKGGGDLLAEYGAFRADWYVTAARLKNKAITMSGLAAPCHDSNVETVALNTAKTMVESYVEGIRWVYAYYRHGGASVPWGYTYKYHTAPCAYDVFLHFPKSAKVSHGVVGQSSLGIIHQAIAILPLNSLAEITGEKRLAGLLAADPVLSRCLNGSAPPSSPPDVFTWYEGKSKDFQGVAVLPEVSLDAIVAFVYAANNTAVLEAEERQLAIASEQRDLGHNAKAKYTMATLARDKAKAVIVSEKKTLPISEEAFIIIKGKALAQMKAV